MVKRKSREKSTEQRVSFAEWRNVFFLSVYKCKTSFYSIFPTAFFAQSSLWSSKTAPKLKMYKPNARTWCCNFWVGCSLNPILIFVPRPGSFWAHCASEWRLKARIYCCHFWVGCSFCCKPRQFLSALCIRGWLAPDKLLQYFAV